MTSPSKTSPLCRPINWNSPPPLLRPRGSLPLTRVNLNHSRARKYSTEGIEAKVESAVEKVLTEFNKNTFSLRSIDPKGNRLFFSSLKMINFCTEVVRLQNLNLKEGVAQDYLFEKSLPFLKEYLTKARKDALEQLTDQISLIENGPIKENAAAELLFLRIQLEDLQKNPTYLIEPLKTLINQDGSFPSYAKVPLRRELETVAFITNLFNWAVKNSKLPEFKPDTFVPNDFFFPLRSLDSPDGSGPAAPRVGLDPDDRSFAKRLKFDGTDETSNVNFER